MAKFFYDATELTDEDLEKEKIISQRTANLYDCIIKMATKDGELVFRPQCPSSLSNYPPYPSQFKS